MQTIKFGSLVEEKVTKVKGIVIAYATYITGCDQYLVQPRNNTEHGEKKPDGYWFDRDRLEVLEEGVVEIVAKPLVGCDIEAPKI